MSRYLCTWPQGTLRGETCQVARFLAEYSAGVTAQDKDESTAVYLAELGHMDLGRFLVEHGADAAAQDKGR